MKILDYLAERALEQGSVSAYVAALSAAYVEGLPMWGRVLIFIAATYKFCQRG